MKQTKRKILLLIFITNCSLQIAVAQQPTEEWVRIYDSPDNIPDHFTDMVTDRFGNIFETGWNVTNIQGNNIVTIKYNNNGTLLWSKEYNSSGSTNDISYGLAVDSVGNCYVAGYTGVNTGPFDGVIIKYNADGDTIWSRKLLTNLDDELTNIAIDINNSVYVTGRSGDTALVFKFDTNGNLLWRDKYFSPPYICQSGKIIIDKLNNIFIVGNLINLSQPNLNDILIRNYSPNGNLNWITQYNSPYNNSDAMSDIAVDCNSNIFVIGSSYNISSDFDILTFKLNNSGILQWQKFFNGVSNSEDVGIGIVCDSLGNSIFLTGTTYVTGFSSNYITIKLNLNGDTLWTMSYNGPGNFQDNVMDISLDKSLNIYITGESSNSSFDFDVATIKYTSSGNQQWITRWSNSVNGSDGGVKIIVDIEDNVLIGGYTSASAPNFLDLLAIKYTQPVGILPISNYIPIESELEQNFPNPFNPNTKIRFNIKEPAFAVINIYNSLGVYIKTLINEKVFAGKYEVDWDATDFPSGIYFYTLIVNDIKETRKMIYIK